MPLSPHPRFHCDRSGLKEFLAIALFSLRGPRIRFKSALCELIAPIVRWEFLTAVGTRAGLFGDESGRSRGLEFITLKLFSELSRAV